MAGTVRVSPARFGAVVLDLDGVLTDTARVHLAAWRRLFDDYLAGRPDAAGEDHAPFADEDYRRYVDGRRREDGAAAFLAARGVAVDPGTLTGLTDRKDGYVLEALARDGVHVFPDAPRLLGRLQAAGLRTGVISASRHCAQVLSAARLTGVVEVRVDGVEAARLGLPGKPDPAVFLEAARRLGVAPARTAVVEDAEAGVAAGAAGGFGLVIGLDRTGHGAALLARGADVVVRHLDAVEVR